MSYTVYFRTGGTENFQWRRINTPFPARYLAHAKCEELRRMGYPAYYDVTSLLDAIGLPTSYERKEIVLQ